MLRIKRITLGVLSILMWLLGVIIPVIPGWPFLVFAIFLLSRDIPLVRPIRKWIETKYPKIVKPVCKWEIQLGLLTPEEIKACGG
jgi:uncharacterized membrane protein YbaN (DUF454 family)